LKSNLAKQIPNLESKVKKECQKNAKNIIKFLESGRFRIIKELKKEMKKASSEEDFEKAVKIRDQIEALEKVLTHAKIFLEPTVPQTSLWYYKEIEEGLKELLKIKKRISRIEAYDVSNIQGNLATGSMVTFISGQPEKNFYRRFKIKINGKPNDIAMLKEILSRRFNHPEWPYPDLILIDGGKAQLSTAQLTVKNYQLTIPIIALAKKRSAGENKLFIEGRKKPILLKNLAREIFNLILQLRDEAHRFARKYHLKRREIDLFKNL
jgi:excinuclease ABC subunit C